MTLFLNIALAVFGLTSTLAAFGGETWSKGGEPLLERIRPRGWLALSCLILAFATGITKEVRAYNAASESTKAKELADRENAAQRQQLATQLNQIRDLQQKLTASTIEQAKYAARIESLSGETRDLVTGGRSYVWLLVARAGTQDGLLPMTAIHGGDKIPAFDVNIRLETTGRCDGVEGWTMGKVMGTGVNDPRRFYLPAVTPNMIHPLSVRLQPTCDDAYYLAYIYTRNRVLFQQTLLKKTDGLWRAATRLRDLVTGDTLHTTVDRHIAANLTWPKEPAANAQLLRVLKKLSANQTDVAAKE